MEVETKGHKTAEGGCTSLSHYHLKQWIQTQINLKVIFRQGTHSLKTALLLAIVLLLLLYF